MFHDMPLYEFNRFAPWELFCSAFRAHKESETAKSPIERLHQNWGLLLFSFAYLEALLNYAIQRETKDEDLSDFLRRKKLMDKLQYLEERVKATIDHSELIKLIEEYSYLRNEIVHFKRTDQQPQFHVQHIHSSDIIRLIQMFSLRVFIATHEEFPYWLTGWNYTGFNGNWRDLFLSNNGNGFGYSLNYMGFQFKPLNLPGTPAFSRGHMSRLEHFDEILDFLNTYPEDAEPIRTMFPTRPRLLRKWWSEASLLSAERDVMRAAGWIKG